MKRVELAIINRNPLAQTAKTYRRADLIHAFLRHEMGQLYLCDVRPEVPWREPDIIRETAPLQCHVFNAYVLESHEHHSFLALWAERDSITVAGNSQHGTVFEFRL